MCYLVRNEEIEQESDSNKLKVKSRVVELVLIEQKYVERIYTHRYTSTYKEN